MVIGPLHEKIVFSRRVERLVELLSPLVVGETLLDVGCGSGLICRLIGQKRPELKAQGMDVLVRPQTHIPVEAYDGHSIPYPDRSFDTVMLVDVVHHAADGGRLLAEVARVARRRVLIKDHNRDGLLALETLRVMDWVGNARHGVTLPYHYWNRDEWRARFARNRLRLESYREDLALYAFPASLLFDRQLHFIASLAPDAVGGDASMIQSA